MRTTITIEDILLEKVKKDALKNNTTIGAIIETCINYFYSMNNNKKKSKKFKLHTVKGMQLIREVNLDKTSEIIDNEDLEIYKEKYL